MRDKTRTRHGFLWFGAAISLAEIMTGTLIAPLGWKLGLLSVFLGHSIGCILLYLAGLIGAETGLPAVKSSRLAFGRYGSYVFSFFNIVQLLGWTAIMIMGGSAMLNKTVVILTGFELPALWTFLIGATIALWLCLGFKNMTRVNAVAVSALFVLTLALSFTVFNGHSQDLEPTLTFGAAVELSVAMSLSWLPLMSDYTRHSTAPKKTAFVSATAYTVGSMWMYAIGMGLSLSQGNTDIGAVLAGAGLGLFAVLIAFFSTVTTTFLDAYSAGVSFGNITNGRGEKGFSLLICGVATVLALFFPLSRYESFLYLLGSFFLPMVTLLLLEYFVYGSRSIQQALRLENCILWALGFILYRVFLAISTPLGSSLPVLILLSLISLGVRFILKTKERKKCLQKP